MQEFSSSVYMEQPVSLGHDGKIKHNNRVTLNHSETKERFVIKISAETILGNESVSWNEDNISHVFRCLLSRKSYFDLGVLHGFVLQWRVKVGIVQTRNWCNASLILAF